MDDLTKLKTAFSLIVIGLYEKEQQKKDASAKQLREYITYIEERKCVRKNLVIGRWPRLNTRVIGGFFTNVLITDKPFRVVEDRCVKCGRCADVCQVDNIEGGKGKMPEWKHNGDCMTCFACYHHCLLFSCLEFIFYSIKFTPCIIYCRNHIIKITLYF